MKKITFLFAFLLSLFGGTQAWADELTVYDGSGSSTYYPVHGNYADTSNSLSEFLIPASSLTEMEGGTISKMTFYISSVAAAKWTSTFTVYMKEVENAAYEGSSAIGDSEATVVYVGELDGTSSTMEVNFTNNYVYNGGNLLIGFKVTTASSVWKSATFVGETQSSYTAFRNKSSNTREKFIPKTTFTYSAAVVAGSAFVVKDGSTKLTSPYAYDFGLATVGATKVFTLSNPGTLATPIAVGVTGANGFTAVVEDNATSIPAGEEKTLTITMPDATASGSIVVTPTGEGLTPFTFNVSGTVRDPNKVYLDFSDGSMPDGWTTKGYTSSYGTYEWVVNTGYISYNGYSSMSAGTFTSPQMSFEKDEKIFFETSNNSSYSSSSIIVEYSLDGTNFTSIGTAFTDDVYNTWTRRSVTIPVSNVKYIRFKGWYINLRNIYGGELANVPVMVVNQPASLNYGIISEATTKTFTITNTGRAPLEGITVTSSNSSVFAISGAPTSLAKGESKEVTITMSTGNVGEFSSNITVSATDVDDVQFTVKGTVLPDGLSVVDFNDNTLPERWTNTGWTFSGGAALSGYGGPFNLTTPKLLISEGDMIVIKAKLQYNSSSYYVTVKGSNDDGVTWTAYSKKLSTDVLNNSEYSVVILSDIPESVNKLQFVGYYCNIDEIQGINYAPVLSVTKDDAAVTTPAAYDFGECGTNATVTYNFANAGAGTINITNVAISGDGAAAYSTNWSASEAAPFDLVITRAYDAARGGAAQEATVTVTTSEGDFVINVTGTDKAANAPELAVDMASIDFGKLTANDTKTVTVTNNGTGSMNVTIASNNALFTVAPASLTGIGAGESMTFDVTFNFDGVAGSYGVKNANVTVTPSYDDAAAVVITATANAKDPNLWDEDFSGNALPTGWELEGEDGHWTFASGFADGANSANYKYGNQYLITPSLEVSGVDATMSFKYKRDFAKMTIEKQLNGGEWTSLYTDASYQTDAEWQTYTITGLPAGDYKFRFAKDDYDLDDFEGFKLATVKAHAAALLSKTIPTSGNQYVEYTASAQVKVSGTNNEKISVSFYIGATKIGETITKDILSGEDDTFEFVFTPTEEMSGYAYFTVKNEDESINFQSEKTAVTIDAATVIDENAANVFTEGDKPSVVLNYTKDAGKWGTITLPFQTTVANLQTAFGKEIKVYEYKSSTENSMTFGEATTLAAGYAYIIYSDQALDGARFFGVDFTATSANYDGSTLKFQATYEPIAEGGMEDKWGVTPDGYIMKGSATATLKAMRGYLTTSDPSAHISIFIEDTTTGITTVLSSKEFEMENVYNLNGQKVNKAQKGLYIVNGKKVVRK